MKKFERASIRLLADATETRSLPSHWVIAMWLRDIANGDFDIEAFQVCCPDHKGSNLITCKRTKSGECTEKGCPRLNTKQGGLR